MLRKGLRFVGLALVVLLLGAWQEPVSGGLPTKAEIDGILRQLSDITGFRIRKDLPFEMVTRDQVNHYLKEQIRHSVKPEAIRADELTLKKLGFAPKDFDLKQNTIDLLTEQAAAFYDFRKKKLFISDWAAQNMREQALVHELAHALADQNFPIDKFLKAGEHNSESSLARQAVVEGQASWLMVEFAARRFGRTLADPDTARQLLRSESSDDDANYPVFAKAPLYIRATLTFPYEQGDKFQQSVFLHDGQPGFGRVFRDPPASSAQVLHPLDLYYKNVIPTSPELPKPAPGAREYVHGEMGELDIRVQLRQYVSRDAAEILSPKLRGGTYRIDQVKHDKRTTLVYRSEWADEAAAREYFDNYKRVLRGKWTTVEASVETPTRFAGKSEDGYFSVQRDGIRVFSEEGFATAR